MRNKEVFSFRRTKNYKAEIAIGVVFLFILAAISGMSTVTMTESGGTLYITGNLDVSGSINGTAGSSAPPLTRIRNSNNNSWAVTETNLATAIADAGTRGTVWIGADLTLTAKIDMSGTDHLTLDFQGHRVTVPVNVPFINITDTNYGTVKNVVILVNSGLTYPEDAGADHGGAIFETFAESDIHRVDFLEISNVFIDNAGEKDTDANPLGGSAHYFHNWTGFYFNVIQDGATYGRIDSSVFRDIVIEGCDEGFKFETSDAGYINNNLIDNIYFNGYERGITFYYNGTNGMNENVFRHVKAQTVAYSEYGVYNIAGTSNRFEDMLFGDWNTATINPNGVYVYNISTKAYNTVIEDHAVATISSILDDGRGSDIECADRKLYYDADYDYKVTRVDDDYYARLGQYGDMPVSGSYKKTTDFQDLMDTICDNSDIVVRLGNGTFLPDRYIAIDGKNITIEGRSDHTTIIKVPSGDSMASGMFSADGVAESNLTFRNIVFDGSAAGGSSVGIYFCAASSIHGLTVDNCIFVGFDVGTSKAIYSRPNTNDNVDLISVTNSWFFNNDYGVHFDGDDDSDINWSIISGNVFDNCDYSIVLDYTNFSIITHNTIKDGGTEGISLQGNSSHNIININQIEATTGIELDGSCNSNIVKDNNVYLCGTKITNSGTNNRVYDNMGDDL